MADAATEIKLIQIGRRSLQLDDATYRLMLASLCDGKSSSKALSAAERQRVLDHMRTRGFKARPRGADPVGTRAAPMVRKLKAMWWALAEDGHVAMPDDPQACFAAVEAWARQPARGRGQVGDALRFVDNAALVKLVEEMKAWCLRVGVEVARSGTQKV